MEAKESFLVLANFMVKGQSKGSQRDPSVDKMRFLHTLDYP